MSSMMRLADLFAQPEQAPDPMPAPQQPQMARFPRLSDAIAPPPPAEPTQNKLRITDFILPAIAGGAAAFSPVAARGVAAGLGALGQVMENRDRAARVQQLLEQKADEKRRRTESLGRILKNHRAANDVAKSSPNSAALLGVPAYRVDEAKLAAAEEAYAAGDTDMALEITEGIQVMRQKPSYEEMLKRRQGLQPGEHISAQLDDGLSYSFTAPQTKPFDTDRRTSTVTRNVKGVPQQFEVTTEVDEKTGRRRIVEELPLGAAYREPREPKEPKAYESTVTHVDANRMKWRIYFDKGGNEIRRLSLGKVYDPMNPFPEDEEEGAVTPTTFDGVVSKSSTRTVSPEAEAFLRGKK